MQASPWYSNERPEEETAKPPVYHNNLCCTKGKTVDKYHHRYGTDNRPLCPRCSTLNSVGR